MNKILITGAAGFIGYNLAKKILGSKKFRLVLVDNLSRGKLDKDFKKLCSSKLVKFIKRDLTRPLNIKDKFKYIFHLASVVGVKNVEKNPLETLKNNIYSTINLIEFIKKKSNPKIIFFSTSEVYSPIIFSKKNIFPLKESLNLFIPDKIKKRDSYFISKLTNEKIITLSNYKYIIFRPHNIYGPRMGLSHVIPELIKKIVNKKKQCLVFSPNHKRAFCYIDDAIEQIYKISLKNNTYNSIYNIGNMKEEITMFNLAKNIKEKINKNSVLKKGNVISGSPYRRVPDMKKTLSKIDIRNFVSLSKGLDTTIKWYTKNEK